MTARTQAWIAEHCDVPRPIAAMVRHSQLSERSFKRRFKAATGYTPLDYVQTLRIEEAKQMLEVTSEGIDAIAHRTGYEDPTSFRPVFKRHRGVTPGTYRQRFRGIRSRSGETD
ncbi:MAG: helix-turn-helix domain-containing protein [Halioglobus sp.]|nr:helix-turn-helix domain-containing protein [Halioglobus sp.]